MANLKLDYTPKKEFLDDSTVFDALKAYLTGSVRDTDPAAAAKSIASTLQGPPGSDGTDAHWSLYNLFIDVAKQIPHDSPALVRLVNVVDKLSLSPKTTHTETTDGCESLKRLHTFGWNLRDVFSSPFEPNRDVSEQQLSSFLSMHAFMALLWSRDLIDGFDFALWQLRSAFEEGVSGDQEAGYQAAAAGLWVVHAGSRVRQLVVDPPRLPEAEERTLQAGDKFGGPGNYNQQRWEFWLGSFEDRAGKGGVDASVSKRAVSVMRGLDGTA